MQSNRVFRRIGGVRPGRSMFDLSYSKLFNCDAGQLIPVMCDEVVPGDVFKISNQIVVRMQPMIAPVLHEINVEVQYFFCPYRRLWYDDTPVSGSWEGFITGGETGNNSDVLPTWTPATANTELYSLWDYLGWPVGANDSSGAIKPMAFPMYSYNWIWNEWYRDTILQTEANLDDKVILYRNWEKDYFTSARTAQQLGTAPSLPLSGTGSAVWPTTAFEDGAPTTPISVELEGADAVSPVLKIYGSGSGNARTNAEAMFESNTFDFADATTFDVADLRLAFQIQRWMERNSRAGARYTEFLHAHFGVSPRDERLDRPEFIGATKSSVIVSEVVQTSESNTTKQGTLAGHGLGASANKVRNYRVPEYGLIMGLLSIMPRTAYAQGINRQWLKETKYDFYSPEFANLSEQAIYDAELYFGADSTDKDVFGYQGRWDEMRTKHDMYCGDMRGGESFEHWHLGRHFASEPSLNETFIKCVPTERYLAVTSEPAFIVHHQNNILAFRPLPVMSMPGLIDH